ncbi:hypothetical protein BC834DRAFT_924681 [Gloeopeniophorella convolvens]|nr:hypothetical protein BC834DRAFT_924681 [Gloeopeniophorella convolvens]
MAPTNKAKASGVSSGSFLELQAQIAKQKDVLSKEKAGGKATAVVGGVKRNGKKPTKWELSNKGVQARAARDFEQERLDRRTAESARAALERKAKIYEKLKKGQSGGLNEAQYESLLVDFESKTDDPYESDSDDVDESMTVPVPEEDDDPIVEYEDEFGRVRSARRSEIPRHLLPRQQKIDDEDEYNPVNFFPVYEPSADRVAAIKAAATEENNPLPQHYDASREVRAKGAGFYQFSADDETREKQMEELRQARQKTEKTRQESGAIDLRPGEAEGMQESSSTPQSRAVEKRKRDLEERRKAVEAKRRKLLTGGNAPDSTNLSAPIPKAEPAATPRQETVNQDTASAADSFLAALEHDLAMGKK